MWFMDMIHSPVFGWITVGLLVVCTILFFVVPKKDK